MLDWIQIGYKGDVHIMDNKLNVRLPMELSELDEIVQELGFNNRSDFVLFAIDLLSGFDRGFLDMIRSYSEGLKLPEFIIIQNFIIKQIALDQADREINGESPKLLDQFIFISDGDTRRIMTGDELLQTLKKKYITELKRSYPLVSDDVETLINQFPELENEIKLNFEINKKD